jgi:hypothetical protein
MSESEDNIIGSPNIASYDPGRSLSRDVDRLSQQVQMLCEAIGKLVDLQSEANQKLEAALHTEVLRTQGR